MSKRKSNQENIHRIANKIVELNLDFQTRNELSVLDIDLLRKHTIDLYDEVNQLRLVMKEKLEAIGNVDVENESFDSALGHGVDVEKVVEKVIEIEVEEVEEVEAVEKAEEVEEVEEVEEIEEVEEVEKVEEVEAVEKVLEVEKVEKEIVEPEEVPFDDTPVMTEETLKQPNPIATEERLAEAEAKVEAEAIKEAANPEEANDLAFKFSNTPIHDLKKAISIAKKFEFINSLFSGNVEKYAYSIHHINNLESGDEAFTYLHELRIELIWDEEDKNFQELANLVRRRYLG